MGRSSFSPPDHIRFKPYLSDNLAPQEVSSFVSRAGIALRVYSGVHHSGQKQHLIISITLNHMGAMVACKIRQRGISAR